MVDPDRNPCAVVGEIVNAVGDRLADGQVRKVVGGDLDGLAGGLPLAARLSEPPYQLTFFVSMLITGSPAARYSPARVLMYLNWASRSGCCAPSRVLRVLWRL